MIQKALFLEPTKILELLPDSFQKMESLEAFKRVIKTWNMEHGSLKPVPVEILVFYEQS